MSGVQRSYLLYVELLAGYLISVECNKKSYIRPPSYTRVLVRVVLVVLDVSEMTYFVSSRT